MEEQQQAADPWANLYTVKSDELSPQQQAAQEYLQQSDTFDAIMAGLAEGLTFGWSDELQSAWDKIFADTDAPGYLTPQKRTEYLKSKSPTAYATADIIGSLVPSIGSQAIPGLQGTGMAPLAARLGAAGLLGGLEAAGKAEEGKKLESIPKGVAIGAAGAGAGELAGAGLAALGQKSRLAREVPLQKQTGPLEKQLASTRKDIAQLQEKQMQKELDPLLQKVKAAEKKTAKAEKGIFDIEEEMGALAGKEAFLGDIMQSEGLRRAMQDIKRRIAGRADLEERAADLEKQIAAAQEAPSEMAMNVLMTDIRKQMGDLAEDAGVLQKQVEKAARGEAAPPTGPVPTTPFEETPFSGLAAKRAEQEGRLGARQRQFREAQEGQSKALARYFEQIQNLQSRPPSPTPAMSAQMGREQELVQQIANIKGLSEAQRKSLTKMIEDPRSADVLRAILTGSGVSSARLGAD